MRVYFDNAATTPLDPLVLEEMLPYLRGNFGNPSSIHTHGREAKTAVERARKEVAALLHTSPSEIFFTSGGTEADNTAILSSVRSLNIKHVISSRLEHHAVLHTLEYLAKRKEVSLHYVTTDDKGQLDIDSLKELLALYPHSLVTLMHGNNEVGNLNDIQHISSLCRECGAIYHADTTQTIGHYPFDLSETSPQLMVASAHKFHGPKGVGFLYKDASLAIDPYLFGGAQERNMRGGTENVAGIIGLAKALTLATERMEQDKAHILNLKRKTIALLEQEIPQVKFNGLSHDVDSSLYTVLNVLLPIEGMGDMVLFNLDIHQISVSAGSACSSGTNIGSHVLQELLSEDEINASIRISFSKYNTEEEVIYLVQKLKEICTNG